MEFNKVELQEKDGKGKIRINDTEIKGISNYSFKRNTDMVEITLTMSVPIENFKTIEG